MGSRKFTFYQVGKIKRFLRDCNGIKKPSQFLLLKLTGIVTNSVIRIQVPNVFDFKAIFVPITPVLLVM